MWRPTTALLTVVALLRGAAATQRDTGNDFIDEVWTEQAVCARAAGTGWFPVIIPGCKEALNDDGYGAYSKSLPANWSVVALKCVVAVATACEFGLAIGPLLLVRVNGGS